MVKGYSRIVPVDKSSKKSIFTKKKINGKSIRNAPIIRHTARVDATTPSTTHLSNKKTHSKRTVASLVMGILMIMVGSTLILVNLLLYSRFQTSGKIVFNNVDPKIASAISKKIIYSTTENGLKDYYSPELDVLLKYPVQKYIISDQVGFVDIADRNRFLLNEGGELRLVAVDKIAGTFNEYLANKYQKKYPNVVVSEAETSGDYASEKLYYSAPDPFDKSRSREVRRLILSRQIKRNDCAKCDVYAYIDFTLNKSTKVDSVVADLRLILDSVSISPKDLEENLTVEMQDQGISFKIDRKKWEVSQNPLSTYLDFRAPKFEKEIKVEGEVDYPYTHISVVTIESSEKIDEEYWQKKIQEDLDSQRSSARNRKVNNFKIVSQNSEEQIGGLTFKKVVFEQSGSLGSTFVATNTNYYGYNSATGFVIEIKISIDDLNSLGAEEVMKVLKTFNFTGVPDRLSYLSLKDRVLGTASVQIEKSSLVGVNSVVHIFNRTCVDIKVKADQDLPNVGGKEYETCSAGFGSGFYVTKNGHIVTNAHVSNWNPDDTVIDSLNSKELPVFWNDFIVDLIAIAESNGLSLGYGEEIKENAMVFFLTLRKEGLIDLSVSRENFIEGLEPFQLNKDLTLANESVHKKAQLIDAYDLNSVYKQAIEAYESGSSFGITVPDLAILKVDPQDSGDYPTMLLADMNSISVGQSIQAIGFPGSAESDYLFSNNALTIPTLTKGTVSAIKPNFDNTFKLLQIDASIAHGNSGGPIIDNNAEVVGVTTYGLQSEMGADFNAGVSAEEVTKLLEKNNIKPENSQVSALIRTGADNLEKAYYKWAVRDFSRAIELYPASEETLGPLVKLANSKIEAKEDKTPAFVFGALTLSSIQMGLMGGGLLIFVFGSVIVLIIIKRKNKDNGSGTLVNQPPIPMGGSTNTPASPKVIGSHVYSNPQPIIDTIPQAAPKPSQHISGHIVIPSTPNSSAISTDSETNK